jgi:hypothetical protein
MEIPSMKEHFRRAIHNIAKFGDTDIFPHPIENFVLADQKNEILGLLEDFNLNFEERVREYPPSHLNALAPVSYTGFRWATQIDPLWNAFFLGQVLSIGDRIESARIPVKDSTIFSYRLIPDHSSIELFIENQNWRSFMEKSLELSKQYKFVVTCDISEFYPRLNHHRLENALLRLNVPGDQPSKIMKFLDNFSNTYSFGLPIGGPAARILSELLLNDIDRTLRVQSIKFCRFADDFHLFADTYEDAFKALLYLSERLLVNQGLQLQKAKTRIMSGDEFRATSPLKNNDKDAPADHSAPDLDEQSQNLLRLSVRFDPYSPTASDDYESLKSEMNKIDLLSLLKAELTKSRVHISLTRRIITAIKYLDESKRNDAILSLIKNDELLYPIYSNVLLTAKTIFTDLRDDAKDSVIDHVRELIMKRSHVLETDLNMSYAIRLLSNKASPENEEALNQVYNRTQSILVRKDIILAMAKYKAAYWLTNIKINFRTLPPAERRAFIVASYSLRDEGKHWRDHLKSEFSPFETVVRQWASSKPSDAGWNVPL